MKTIFLSFLLSIAVVSHVAAQDDDLFGTTTKLPPRHGWIIGVNGDLDMPAADLASRFGTSYRIGAAVHYKTTSNWVIGPKVDFILGDHVNEDSLMIGIMDQYHDLLNQDGVRTNVRLFERGYAVGMQGGKIFNLSKKSSENGILVLTSVGFMQYKINIFDKDKTIPTIRDDYKKGYDRLTNGAFVEQYVGYSYFANNGLANFHIGLDVMFGFTQGRRDYQFDIMRADNAQRLDILCGIRGGWYIPMFKRKSEEFYFQ